MFTGAMISYSFSKKSSGSLALSRTRTQRASARGARTAGTTCKQNAGRWALFSAISRLSSRFRHRHANMEMFLKREGFSEKFPLSPSQNRVSEDVYWRLNTAPSLLLIQKGSHVCSEHVQCYSLLTFSIFLLWMFINYSSLNLFVSLKDLLSLQICNEAVKYVVS